MNVNRNANLREQVASVRLNILGCVKLQYLASTLIHWLKGVLFQAKEERTSIISASRGV